MVSRCDFYSDEEYEYALLMEIEEYRSQLAMEEEMARIAEEEYWKEQEKKLKRIRRAKHE